MIEIEKKKREKLLLHSHICFNGFPIESQIT